MRKTYSEHFKAPSLLHPRSLFECTQSRSIPLSPSTRLSTIPITAFPIHILAYSFENTQIMNHIRQCPATKTHIWCADFFWSVCVFVNYTSIALLLIYTLWCDGIVIRHDNYSYVCVSVCVFSTCVLFSFLSRLFS